MAELDTDNLNSVVDGLLRRDDPVVDFHGFHDGENLVHESRGGLKYVAHLRDGKVAKYEVSGPRAAEAKIVVITSPAPILPDHVKVCMCTPDGDSCWWQPNVGELGTIHPA